MSLLKILTRILAFTGKELVETFRRPGAIVSLLVGPFLILLAFGFSYNGIRRPLDALLVVPPGSGLPTETSAYTSVAGAGLRLQGITADEGAAVAELSAGTVDLVIVAPVDPQASLQAGEQARIRVLYSILDPIRAANADALASQVSAEVNRYVLRQAAAEGQQAGAAQGLTGLSRIPPEVLSQPTTAETANLAPSQPGVIPFFGPAAAALVLQHIALTLMALALVRERGRGRPELFRLSPTTTGEIVIGKALAFLFLGGLVALLLVAALIQVFAVPVLASIDRVALIVLLLLLASLAYGTAIAAISDSERQAVQLSLLLLLASVFFGGFVLSVSEFGLLGQAIAAALPVTHGVTLLQDAMLRGSIPGVDLAALAVMAIVLFVPGALLLRRSLLAG